MNVRKSVAPALAALMLLLSIAPAWATPARAADAPIKLELLSFPDHPKQTLLEVYERSGLPYELSIVEVPQNQYEQKVRMKLFSGEAPDLVLIDTPNIASYAVTGALEPLDGYWDAADFADLVDSSREALRYDGHIWAAPLNQADCLLFYNKALLAAEGITPATSLEDAWTLEQLLDAAKRLTKTDATGRIVQYGLLPSMFTPDNKNEGMAFTQMLYTWWFGAEVLDPDGSAASGYFDAPESIEAVRFYADLFGKYRVAPREEIPNGFTEGKIAMWITGPWLLGAWKESHPAFYEGGWGAMPLPRGASRASASGSWNIAITRDCRDKAAAWRVIEALTGAEAMRLWCDRTGNLPARKSILDAGDAYRTEPPYDILSAQLLFVARPRPVSPFYPEISEALVDCFNSAAFGADPEQAVRAATARIDAALGAPGRLR
ncbi:extracellular solute-binding protein [Bacillota bacterium Meth-B3]